MCTACTKLILDAVLETQRRHMDELVATLPEALKQAAADQVAAIREQAKAIGGALDQLKKLRDRDL